MFVGFQRVNSNSTNQKDWRRRYWEKSIESERGSEKEIPNWYWHIKLTSNFTDDETNRSDCQSITRNQTEIRSFYYEVFITNCNRQNLKFTWEIIFKCTRIEQKSISILCSSIQFNWPNYHTFKSEWFGLENWNAPNKLRNTAPNIFDNILPHCSYAQVLMKQMWFVIIVKIIQGNINELSNKTWIFQNLQSV